MAPETRYADGGKGLVAYQVLGDGPIDLVYLTGSTSHVDVRWELPAGAAFLERLASFSRLILFDRRGAGVSDRVAPDALPTWEEWADDLRLVLDVVGSGRAVIFAVLDAGPMGMLFAASHPDRTTALVLGNTAAKYVAAEDYPQGFSSEGADLLVAGIEASWGTEGAAVGASPSIANDGPFKTWFAKYMRASASPRAVAAQFRALFDSDLRDVLSAIRVPTLVLNRESFPWATAEMGRYLAERIPDAKFVQLPGSDSIFYSDGYEQILDTVEEFVTGVRPTSEPDRVLATVLFTDLVDSTRRAAAMGDSRWRRTLDQHETMARAEIERHRGRLIKTTGDGTVATFDAPGRAIRCAVAMRTATASLGLQLRAGLHTGEVELRGNDIGGISVHTAARVGAMARANEVLVSRTVVDLVAGSAIEFEDRGEHDLRGVPGVWKLHAVKI